MLTELHPHIPTYKNIRNVHSSFFVQLVNILKSLQQRNARHRNAKTRTENEKNKVFISYIAKKASEICSKLYLKG